MAQDDDRFEVYQDRRGDWRWRRLDEAGVLVGAACEGYSSRADAESNMRRGYVPLDRWEFYKDKRGLIRWRRMAANGKIVGAATEGFATRADAEANAARQGWRAAPTSGSSLPR
ncbi:MAG: hypothetical protein ACFBWO_17260 [Paracoccaceae bacterium]